MKREPSSARPAPCRRRRGPCSTWSGPRRVRLIADPIRRLAAALSFGFAAITGAVPAGALEQATVAFPAVTPLFVILDVAEDRGLWQKYGVDLKSVDVPGVGAVNAVIS